MFVQGYGSRSWSDGLCCPVREVVSSTFCFAKRWSQKAPTIQASVPPRTGPLTSPRRAVAARIVDTYRTHPADTCRLVRSVLRIARLVYPEPRSEGHVG